MATNAGRTGYETDWKQLIINKPISFYDKTQFDAHREFLNEKVFPALDELKGKALIYNYHILHNFHIRFRYTSESKVAEIEKVFKKHKVEGKLEDYPGDTPEKLKILPSENFMR